MARRKRFSERVGASRVPEAPLVGDISEPLRNSLWNLLLLSLFSDGEVRWISRIDRICRDVLYRPVDEIRGSAVYRRGQLRIAFFDLEWAQVLDLIEYVAENYARLSAITGEAPRDFEEAANDVLEEHFSGYRFVAGVLCPITNLVEIESIEEGIEVHEDGLVGTGVHLSKAVSLMSQRPSPDYPNSIKESISAIESLVRQLTGDPKGSLSTALRLLGAKIDLHPALQLGIDKLYGYTSDEDGIRHAILKEKQIGFDEAKYMLVACSALVNFLVAKADQAGLLNRG